jgi:hypothetical protein
VPVQHPRKGDSRQSEPFRRIGDAQPKWLEHILAQNLAGVGMIVDHGTASMIVEIVNQFDIATDETKRDAPMTIDPDRPKSL